MGRCRRNWRSIAAAWHVYCEFPVFVYILFLLRRPCMVSADLLPPSFQVLIITQLHTVNANDQIDPCRPNVWMRRRALHCGRCSAVLWCKLYVHYIVPFLCMLTPSANEKLQCGTGVLSPPRIHPQLVGARSTFVAWCGPSRRPCDGAIRALRCVRLFPLFSFQWIHSLALRTNAYVCHAGVNLTSGTSTYWPPDDEKVFSAVGYRLLTENIFTLAPYVPPLP
jgi:hypothetical protein